MARTAPYIPRASAGFWNKLSSGYRESLFGHLCRCFVPALVGSIELKYVDQQTRSFAASHAAVFTSMANPAVARVLDVGCGTGE